MKKLFTIVLILLTLASCNEFQNSSKLKEENPKLKIEKYFDTLSKSYAGYEENSVIREEMNEFLKTDFSKKVEDGLIEDLPFLLEEIKKCNNKYIAVLEHSLTSKYYEHGILDDVELEFYAETDEETAKNLIEKKYYLIKGSFQEYITCDNNKKYCALVLMSPFMGFQAGGVTGDEIEFGAIGIKLDSIRQFTTER